MIRRSLVRIQAGPSDGSAAGARFIVRRRVRLRRRPGAGSMPGSTPARIVVALTPEAGDTWRMGSANVDLMHSIYAAWERGDYGSAEWADPEIEHVVADGPTPGSWRGAPARSGGQLSRRRATGRSRLTT